MKLTADKSVIDLPNFIGKACILKYILNGRHEIEIQMPINWKMDELANIIKDSFLETEFPKSVHILSIEKNISVLN